MKVRKQQAEGIQFGADALDFAVAEQMLVLHLIQTLDIIRGTETALILSDVEWNVLHKVLTDRLAKLIPPDKETT